MGASLARFCNTGRMKWLLTKISVPMRKQVCWPAAGAPALLGWGTQPGFSEEVKDYGKPGSPVDLVVGYQPYYTKSWSGVIMRNKKFYEKYLPQGSKIDFQVGLQGAIIVNGMLAGKVDLGYVGDMPGIVSTSHAEVRDIRIVAGRRARLRPMQRVPGAHRCAAVPIVGSGYSLAQR